jgi:4-alpha-glucanotransferase
VSGAGKVGRRSGLLIPLFSCPSTASWGIGEITDVAPVTAWLAAAGQRVWQLLPLNEMAPGQQSPYSAVSALAIDPIYIHVPAVAEFQAIGGEAALSGEHRELLAAVRRAPRVEYQAVRQLKQAALRAAFERFLDAEWWHETDRSCELAAFLIDETWWIDDYSLFRAIHARELERPWTEWPEALQRREPAAMDEARCDLAREVLFQQYLQWLAAEQWRHARAQAHGVALFGDLPFMVDADSADVWTRSHEFRLDVSVGAPPDAFSKTGQNWGMPLYRWDVMAGDGFAWLRDRARRGADLFDGFRVDHLVGFYRTFGWPKDGQSPFFTPSDEPSQLALGERLLEVFRGAGAEILAEDLGTIPDFVRESLARLGVPGFRVLRWERHWLTEGQPFWDPAAYPRVSVAASGTHDTEPLATWWDGASPAERRAVSDAPAITRLSGGADLAAADYDADIRDVLLEALYASGSDLLLLPVQDVFGWRDRINVPATITDANWTFRLPWPSDMLDEIPEAMERKATLRGWAARYQRL